MIQFALFDLDGTLLDTLTDIAYSCNRALRLCGFPMRREEEYRAILGMGIRYLVRHALPEADRGDEEAFEKVLSLHREYYSEHYMDNTKPYPGIIQMLEDLKKAGVRSAILSNKPHNVTQMQAELYFPGMLAGAFGQRDGVPNKPDAAAVAEVLTALGANREDCVYIGDTEVDAQTARNGGMDVIGVEWGFRPRQVLVEEGVGRIAGTAGDVVKFIVDKS